MHSVALTVFVIMTTFVLGKAFVKGFLEGIRPAPPQYFALKPKAVSRSLPSRYAHGPR